MHLKALLSLSLVFASCTGVISELEPDNNDRKKRQVLKSDQYFEASYFAEKGRDIDYLFLPVAKGSMIRGELTGVKGVDGMILLYKPGAADPFKIINDSQSSLGEQFGPLWIDPPGVEIAIQPRRNVNQAEYKELVYQFRANTFSPSTPIEYEPNDSIAEAQEITQGSIIGYYSNVFASPRKLERDFFMLKLEEDKKFSIKADLSGVEGIDAILRVYNSRGDKLKVIDERGAGQGETLLSYGLQGPGKLYFSVNSKDHKINVNQYYELKISESEYESKYELEPNDTRDKASVLKEDETFGEIADRHDVDFYRFKNENSWPVKLNLTIVPEDNLNARVLLYSKRETRPLLFDDGGKEENEGISNRIVGPGEVVYIKLFTLDWEGSEPLHYEMQLKAEQLVDNVELEPNNSSKKANEVLPDSTVIGYINPNLDIDYFRLKTAKQQKFKILLDGLPDCRLSLSIADRFGQISQNRKSKSMGSGISLTAGIEPNGLIIVSCMQSRENLFSSPYNMAIQSPAIWREN